MKKGFSTLFIVIILGSAMLGFVFTLSVSSLWSLKTSSNIKNSNQSKALVNACAEVALEAIRTNTSYVGISDLILSNNICTYNITNTGGNNRLISVSGSAGNIVRKLEITTNSFNPIIISSWQEVP